MHYKFLILIAFIAISQTSYIPYQAHGFNDLNYFTQLLIKGVNYFKLDLSAVVRESCLQQSSWEEYDNDCEIFSNKYEICCLAFRGDTSSYPILNQPFNTSMDLIELFKNPRYAHILKHGASYPYNHTVKLAINFQYSDPQANLTKQFIYALMKTIEDYDLDFYIVTGSDSFVFSYIEKCAKGQCDEVDKYIANAPITLQSTSYNPNTFYGQQRFHNFNLFYNSIKSYCSDGFPSWITKYDQPLIFWEPSHEYQVQLTRTYWESPACKLQQELKNLEKLRISSNLEPEMIQVYWKKPVEEIAEGFDPEDQKAILYDDKYFDPAIDHSTFCDYFIVALNSRDSNTAKLRVYTYNFAFVDEIDLEFHVLFARSQQELFLVQGENEAILFKFDKSETGYCIFSDQEHFSTRDSEQIALSYNSNEIVYFYMDEEEKTITFSFVDLETKKENGKYSYQAYQTLQTPSLYLGFDSYFSNTTNTYHIAITFTKFGLQFGERVELAQHQKIYMSILELNENYELKDNIAPQHHIDFGSTNDLKLYEFNGQMYLLAIHTNGLCQSAILLNNNEWNKCLYENYAQYSAISNVPHMINYFWGKLEHIKERVETGHKVNGCDLEIMHAKVGNGQNPSITLREMNQGEVHAYVVADYVSYKDQPQLTQLFCGSMNSFDNNKQSGILFFSFDIVHPNQLDLI